MTDGLPAVKAAAIADAVASAVAEERRRFVVLARATCACQSCKDGIAQLLSETAENTWAGEDG